MKPHAAAILVILWLGVFAVYMVKGSVGSQSMRKWSCVGLSTQQPNIQNLVKYARQRGSVRAIMFIDIKGVRICVNPDQKWVQAAIKKIDQKRTTRGK